MLPNVTSFNGIHSYIFGHQILLLHQFILSSWTSQLLPPILSKLSCQSKSSSTIVMSATSSLDDWPLQAGETLLAGLAFGLILLLVSRVRGTRNTAPIVNPKKWPDLTWERAGKEFAYNSKEILSKATRAMNGKPFQVYSTQGFMTVIPSKHIQEIRNDDRFDFALHTHVAFNGSTPGFEAFDQRNDSSWWLVQIAQKHLTTYLNQMSVPLSEECSKDLDQYLGNDAKWHTIDPSEKIGRIVSKMSTRIFLGQEFCDDERWIEASRNYATKAFAAQDLLSLWPPYLRSIVHWFLPYCKQLRKDVAVCRSVIEGKLKERERIRALREKQGQAPEVVQDTLEWMKKVGKGRSFDPTKVQLALSLAAIHTTTDLITWLLLCLAQNPEVIQPLRDEIVSVLKADGWKKTSLYNLKLMDSAMKESQRLKPNVLGEYNLALA